MHAHTHYQIYMWAKCICARPHIILVRTAFRVPSNFLADFRLAVKFELKAACVSAVAQPQVPARKLRGHSCVAHVRWRAMQAFRAARRAVTLSQQAK